MSNIILAYCTAGGGHKTAAYALKEEIEKRGHTVLIADILSFTAPLSCFLYSSGYTFVSEKIPKLWKIIYKITDKSRMESSLVNFLQNQSAHQVKGFLKFIKENNIDTVVCTHFLPLALLGNAKRKNEYTGKIYCCITDFEIHGFWVDQSTDFYSIGALSSQARLINWNTNPEHIKYFGIPTKNVFHTNRRLRKLSDNALNILCLVHTLNTSYVLKLITEIVSINYPITLNIITGNNIKSYDKLTQTFSSSSKEINIYHYVPNMYTFMTAADILISKPGGLTCNEALCNGLPMLLIKPIPMQETYNAQYLSDNGAGKLCLSIPEVIQKLTELFTNTTLLEEMSTSCLQLAKPHAASDLIDTLLQEDKTIL